MSNELRAPRPAMHRAVICTDIAAFGDLDRTLPDQVAIRDGLYQALRDSFLRSGVSWQDCYTEDRGDGVLILVLPKVPKEILGTAIPRELAAALHEHNRIDRPHARIRCVWHCTPERSASTSTGSQEMR